MGRVRAGSARFGSRGRTRPQIGYSFDKQNWAPRVAAEVTACRSGAALFDQSTFAKFDLSGRGCALRTLQWLCGNDVDVPVGRIVYTGMFNARGTFESDRHRGAPGAGPVSPHHRNPAGAARRRLDPAPRGRRARDVDAARRQLPASGWSRSWDRRRARSFRASESGRTSASEAFPFGHSAEISGGRIRTVRALRVTLRRRAAAWELHGPADVSAGGVGRAAGQPVPPSGIRARGRRTPSTPCASRRRTARSASELSVDEDSVRGRPRIRHSPRSKEFLGPGNACTQLKGQPLRKRLAGRSLLEGADPSVTLWGNEPIFRDGALVGYTSSAAFSPTLGQPVAMGYIKRPSGEPVDKAYLTSGRCTVLQNGIHWPARVCLEAPVDPKREKILRDKAMVSFGRRAEGALGVRGLAFRGEACQTANRCG